jgi:hypothetical protein
MRRTLFALIAAAELAAPAAALESGATCDADDSDAIWRILQAEQTAAPAATLRAAVSFGADPSPSHGAAAPRAPSSPAGRGNS